MLDRLTDAGYKITEPRRRVLAALSEAQCPLTAQEVAVAADASVASTYRALTLLVELGIVSELEDPAEREGRTPGGGEARGKRYSLCVTREYHHHFTCRGCHTTLEMTCEALERALADLAGSVGVVIEHHDVNLRGLCGACRRQWEAAQ